MNFKDANIVKERLSRQMLKKRGVHAIGVGLHNPKQPRKGAAIIVYTGAVTATTLNRLGIKKKATIRSRGKKVSVPIRVLVTPKFQAHAYKARQQFTRRIRPVQAGYSVGTPQVSGTAGLIVAGSGESRYLLSNNHVLNQNNTSGYSETIQPGGADDGRARVDRIGQLSRFVRLKKKGTNLLDAAISVPIRRSILSPRYAIFGALPGHVNTYKVGDKFKKVGRTTGLTQGTVESVNTDIQVDYGDYGNLGIVNFKNQTVVRGEKPVSLSGDSGSVWLTNRGNFAAAVNYAGSADGKLSISFPVQWAMQAFGIRVAKPGSASGRVKTRKIRGDKQRYALPLTAKELGKVRVVKASSRK
nr:S1 family peptidase [Paenibacillus sp. CAA11]